MTDTIITTKDTAARPLKTKAETKVTADGKVLTQISFIGGAVLFEEAARMFHAAVGFIPALRGSRLQASFGDDFSDPNADFSTVPQALAFFSSAKAYPAADPRFAPEVKASVRAGGVDFSFATSKRSAEIAINGEENVYFNVYGEAWVDQKLVGRILNNLRKAGFEFANTVRKPVSA